MSAEAGTEAVPLGFRARLDRVLPSTLSPLVRVCVIGGYAVALLLSVLVLLRWLVHASDDTGPIGQPFDPLVSVVLLLALAVINALLALAALRSGTTQRLGLGVVAVGIATFASGWLPRMPGRQVLAVVLVVALAVALIVPLSADRPRQWLRVSFAALPCLLPAALQPFLGAADRLLIGIRAERAAVEASIGLSTLAVFAVLQSIRESRERSVRATERPVSVPMLTGILAAKAALLAALYAHLTGDFLGGPKMWTFDRAPLTWVHALVVASAIVALGLRSLRLPVVEAGMRPRLAALAATLGLMELAAVAAFVLLMAVDVFVAGATWPITLANWVVDHGAALQIALVAGLFVGTLVRMARGRFRRITSGQVFLVVAGVWLLPPLIGIAFGSPVTFWAVPGQVDAALTVLAGVLLLRSAVRGSPNGRRWVLAIIVVPLVFHLENLLPESWTAPLLSVLVVLAAAKVLVGNAPPVGADRIRTERERCLTISTQLAILVAYYVLAQSPALREGPETSAFLAWLWFAIPLVSVLTARSERSAS